MKIYDCFMYFDEDLILEIRLNYLSNFIDKFIIIESSFNHRGEKRNPQFNINKFERFKDKIEYILIEEQPQNIEKINAVEDNNSKSLKFIMNEVKQEKIVVDKTILKAGHHHGSTFYEHKAFINAIQNNLLPEVSLNDGLVAVAIGEAAELSIKENRVVLMSEFSL